MDLAALECLASGHMDPAALEYLVVGHMDLETLGYLVVGHMDLVALEYLASGHMDPVALGYLVVGHMDPAALVCQGAEHTDPGWLFACFVVAEFSASGHKGQRALQMASPQQGRCPGLTSVIAVSVAHHHWVRPTLIGHTDHVILSE